MVDGPLVSVVIPTRDRADYVAQTVESALAQTWPALEVIVIDDGSTDDTRERLAEFGDAIRYHFKENAGLQVSRNRGVRLARGEFIALLDSDDLWLPGKLERDMEYLLSHPEVGMVCARMAVIDGKGVRTGGLKPASPPGATVEEVADRGSALSSTFVIRREVLRRTGGFDEGIRRFTDLDFVLTVLETDRIELFPEPLALYRDHPGSLSKDTWGFFAGRYRVTRKWSRRSTNARLRRVCLRHMRDCSRIMAAGYLRQGRPLLALRYAGAHLVSRLRLLAPTGG